MVEFETKKSKPRWWTTYWIAIVVLIIFSGFAVPFFLNAPLVRTSATKTIKSSKKVLNFNNKGDHGAHA